MACVINLPVAPIKNVIAQYINVIVVIIYNNFIQFLLHS